MKNAKILVGVVLIIIIGVIVYFKFYQREVVQEDLVVGCYVANLANDVYTLKIADQQGEAVNGTLVFKNFEKDSSHGTFDGIYKDGILLADYTFNSEGMESVMQVVFKKSGNNFVRGYGPVDAETGTHFTDLNTITYDPNQTFIAAPPSCATTL